MIIRRWMFLLALFGSIPFIMGTANVDDYYRFGLGARALGMGTAQTGDVSGSYSFYWNPAGLGRSDRTELTSMVYRPFGVVDTFFLGATIPLAERTFITAGFFQTSVSDIVGASVNGDRTGENFGYSGSVASVALGHQFSANSGVFSNFSFGATAKLMSQTLQDEKGDAFSLDLGVQYQLSSDLRLGAVFQNAYQSGFSWDTGTDQSLDFVSKWGAAFDYHQVTFVLDFLQFQDRPSTFLAGLEWRMFEMEDFSFAWRGGYRKDVLSLGVGTYLWGFQFDYVYLLQNKDVIGDQHFFSMTVSVDDLNFDIEEMMPAPPKDVEKLNFEMEDEYGFKWIDYVDMTGNSFRKTAERLKRLEMLPNTAYFKPNLTVSRELLAVHLFHFFDLSPKDLSSLPAFSDVEKTRPSYPEIATLVQRGTLYASDKAFFPNRPVTRAEMAKSILHIFENMGEVPNFSENAPYEDISYDKELVRAVSGLLSLGMVESERNFYPMREITVLELIKILSKAPSVSKRLQKYEDLENL